MSARTLQRRLDDEGTRYSALVEREREAMACTLLDDPTITLAVVAERVGFGDLASFGRAFKRWTGTTPGAWRRMRRDRGRTREHGW
jgi:AraC-like DNA-binding protein